MAIRIATRDGWLRSRVNHSSKWLFCRGLYIWLNRHPSFGSAHVSGLFHEIETVRRNQRALQRRSALTSRNASGGKIIRPDTNSALRTATLRRDPLSTYWLLENISDSDETTE
ncbi:hypothetical protein BJQ89_03153 [Arthrobacter sp. ES1]|nr:hypothetical protein [Arthrobacter sp. ES1]